MKYLALLMILILGACSSEHSRCLKKYEVHRGTLDAEMAVVQYGFKDFDDMINQYCKIAIERKLEKF